jgi:hypothetical protein
MRPDGRQRFALRRPAEINLLLEDRGAYIACPHDTFQPVADSLTPSEQDTNLPQHF